MKRNIFELLLGVVAALALVPVTVLGDEDGPRSPVRFDDRD